jgi:hypothetical protein
MRRMLAMFVLAAAFITAGSAESQPATATNNDSCEIGVAPAATLLLPYFEVDRYAPLGGGANTLFTVTNTSPYAQIAHVTLWTDWSFPVLNFNLFLTGYDVRAINLFDVIVRGIVAPGATPAKAFGTTSNPNFFRTSVCPALPISLPPDLVTAALNALTYGSAYVASTVSCGSLAVGGYHGTRAVGYATIDVVSYCSTQFPTDAGGAYFLGPNASILFDNVLIGDYQQIGPTPGGFEAAAPFEAQGGPMVHIRAIPEGGLSGTNGGASVPTNLPFTFYDRYTPAGARTADRRQPLPSRWAARYIQGGTAGFATDFKIWREGVTGSNAGCRVTSNSAMPVTDYIRFDEHENSFGVPRGQYCGTCAPNGPPSLPATSRRSTTVDSQFPPMISTDLGGWMFLNLSIGAQDDIYYPRCVTTLSAQRPGFALSSCATAAPGTSGSRSTMQSWVTVSMYGAVGINRLSVDFDAASLGNGCTPEEKKGAIIAPATAVNP